MWKKIKKWIWNNEVESEKDKNNRLFCEAIDLMHEMDQTTLLEMARYGKSLYESKEIK